MVDSSNPNCLSDVNAYHTLTTDPLRILLVRQNGLALRIVRSDYDLPVGVGVLLGDIDTIGSANVNN